MAKSVHNDVLDGALNVIKTDCDKMTACSAEPTTFAEGDSAYALADVAMAGSDFAVADGDTSGRKITTGQKSGVTVDSSGTATHVALLDTASGRLLYVTTCTSQALTAGNTMTFEAWDIEIADPS